ncbi:MAG: head GIN domain-containing protein [bacterium]
MKNLNYFICLLALSLTVSISAQEKTFDISNNFDKIIVSPHIAADFVKGDKASIVVESISEPIEKLQYELKNGTLQVYLEDAKTITKNEKIYHSDGWKQKKPVYNNTVAKVTITYVDVNTFSVRGEEKIHFKSPLNQDSCTLRIYGAPEVVISDAQLENFRVAIYGESDLSIEKGNITKQKITAYGASNVRASNVQAKDGKITAYGDGTYQFNVSDRFKVTSYGEATILYKGNPDIKKGIVIGEATISRI